MAEISVRLGDAFLRYYMHIQSPSSLSDEEWAEELQNLHYIRQQEAQASKPQ